MTTKKPIVLNEEFDAVLSQENEVGSINKDCGLDFCIPPLSQFMAEPLYGSMIVLGARPSEGKSSFALQLALNSALENNADALYFSLEMRATQLVRRLFKTQLGNVTDAEEIKEKEDSIKKLAQTSIYIDDTPSIEIEEMRTKIREFCLTRNSWKTVRFC